MFILETIFPVLENGLPRVIVSTFSADSNRSSERFIFFFFNLVGSNDSVVSLQMISHFNLLIRSYQSEPELRICSIGTKVSSPRDGRW